MKNPLPDGASEIYDLRVNKKMVPNDTVFISLVGDLYDCNWVVYASPDKSPSNYDWRWVVNLRICLVYGASVHRDIVKDYAETIARYKPNGGYSINDTFHGFLYLWNADKQAGAHLTYAPEIYGDAELNLTNFPAEVTYRRVYPYELHFLNGVEIVK